MKILQICAYAAPYEGNFMKSLYALEERMAKLGYETIYAFPVHAEEHRWCRELAQSHQVYFLPVSKAAVNPKVYKTLYHIFKVNPDVTIAHSHFECYDVPLNIAASPKTKIFWHLHDPIIIGSGTRRMMRRLHYGIFSRNVQLISVAEKYRLDVVNVGFPKQNSQTVLNGIELIRISDCCTENKPIDFVTFGWNYHVKGVDVVLKASDLLFRSGYNFRIIINGNDSTLSQLKQFYNGLVPEYVIFQNFCEDINQIFIKTKVYIQASRRETFAYAVAESAYAGLTVISSDIYGLEWAHEVPSVRFFESENAVALAQVMRQSLAEPASSEDIKQSRKIIKEKYSIDCWVNNIIKLYDN